MGRGVLVGGDSEVVGSLLEVLSLLVWDGAKWGWWWWHLLGLKLLVWDGVEGGWWHLLKLLGLSFLVWDGVEGGWRHLLRFLGLSFLVWDGAEGGWLWWHLLGLVVGGEGKGRLVRNWLGLRVEGIVLVGDDGGGGDGGMGIVIVVRRSGDGCIVDSGICFQVGIVGGVVGVGCVRGDGVRG